MARSRVELFEAIRRDERLEQLSVRALADRHGVHRRTVRQALANAVPPERKTPVRVAPKLEPAKRLIDAMLTEDLISPAGTVLLGRTSFIGMSAYWSQVADAPRDPSNRALSDVNRETSRIYNRLPKVVVSDSYTVPAANPWHHTTTVVPRNDVQSWLKVERTRGEGDVLTFASRIMWNGLLREGLMDELHLMLGPEAVGGGTPVLDAPARFTLADVRRFDASDNVLLRYSMPSRSS